jgi:hypothetical protein
MGRCAVIRKSGYYWRAALLGDCRSANHQHTGAGRAFAGSDDQFQSRCCSRRSGGSGEPHAVGVCSVRDSSASKPRAPDGSIERYPKRDECIHAGVADGDSAVGHDRRCDVWNLFQPPAGNAVIGNVRSSADAIPGICIESACRSPTGPGNPCISLRKTATCLKISRR